MNTHHVSGSARVWRGLTIVLGLVVVGVAALVARVAIQNERRGAALVAEVLELSKDKPRPVHRAPELEGTFEECVAPFVDAVADGGALAPATNTFRFGSAPKEVQDDLGRGLDGGVPFRNLTQRVQQDFATLESWAGGVADCSRMRSVGMGLLEGMGPFGEWGHPRERAGFVVQTASKVNTLGIRKATQSGNPAVAVQRCADLLANGRDLALDRGLVGAMFAKAIAGISEQSCGAAVAISDSDALRRFLDELAIIRRGQMTFGQVLRMERVQMQLRMFGRFLPADGLARLPRSARADIFKEQVWNSSYPRVIALFFWWGGYLHQLDRMIVAADTPQRDAVFAELGEHPSLVESFLSDGLVDTGWPLLAARHNDTTRTMDLLESIARVRLGEAPLANVSAARDGDSLVLAVDFEWTGNPRSTARVQPLQR